MYKKQDKFLYLISAVAVLASAGIIGAALRFSPGEQPVSSEAVFSEASRPSFSYEQSSIDEVSNAVLSPAPVSSVPAVSSASITAWKDTERGRGTSNGNTSNDGLFAEWRDGTIFFANPGDEFKLYRYNKDGKIQKVSDDVVYYLNVVGDWIYYSSVQEEGKLCRIRPDGSAKMLLCKDDSWWTNALDGWLYFNGDGANLHRIGLDGKNYTKLTEEKVTWVNIAEDGHAYVILSRENERICRFNLDGSGKTILAEDAARFLIYNDGWLYYISKSDGNTLYKVSTDGTNRTKLTAGATEFINVSGGWIFYSNTDKNGALYKMKTDGSGAIQITSDKAYYINTAGGWIFYINESDRGLLYKIKSDGTGRKKVG